MGYYTSHEISVYQNDSELSEEKIKDLTVSKFRELDVIGYAFTENLNTYDSVKWYNHQSHMKILSEYIKDVVFLLEGEGEESGDVWKEYWLNGRVQKCKARLEFDDFSVKKLKSI